MSTYHIAALSRNTSNLVIAQLETPLNIKQLKHIVKTSPEQIYPQYNLSGSYDIVIARDHDHLLYTIDSFIATYPHK